MAPNAPSIEAQATIWLDRMNRSAFDSADGERFDAWMNADPRHRDAFAEILAIWESDELAEACAAEPEPVAQAEEEAEAEAEMVPAARWKRPLGAAALTAAAAVVAFVLVPAMPHDYVSAPGKTRHIALADGSTIDLGGNSAVRVQFLPWRRTIDLDRGEASFDIAREMSRPLSVRVGATEVNVLGTAFHVDRLGTDRVVVAVLRGKVQVVSGSDELALTASQAAQAMSGRLKRMRFEPEQEIASGWFVAKDAPLADLVEKLRRYSGAAILISSNRARDMRVTGRFNVEDVRGTIETLSSIYDIEVSNIGSDIYIK